MALLSTIDAHKPSKWNLNSILHLIAICALLWVLETVTSSKDRLSKIDEQLAVMAASNNSKWEQLNRIEEEVNKQRDQLHDLQIELAKLKSGK